MRYLKVTLLMGACLFNGLLFAQQKREILLTDILKDVIRSKKDVLIENAIVSMKDISAGEWPNLADSVYVNGVPLHTNQNYLELHKYLKVAMKGELEFIDDRVVIPGEIFFSNCEFPDGLILNGLHLNRTLGFSRVKSQETFHLEDVYIHRINSHWGNYSGLEIRDSFVKEDLHFHWDAFTSEFGLRECSIGHKVFLQSVKLNGHTIFDQNEFRDVKDIELTTLSNDSIYFGRSWTIFDRLYMEVSEASGIFEFTANQASSQLTTTDIYWFNGNFNEVNIRQNRLRGFANYSMSADRFIYQDNQFDKISIYDFSFSETLNDIKWQDFAGHKLCILNVIDWVNQESTGFINYDISELGITDSLQFDIFFDKQSEMLTQIYLGENDEEMRNDKNFRNLFRSYYKLYSALRANGDIESANACYIEMKKMESRNLRYRFNETGDYDYLFRLGLNNLLNFYTDQGTNPAKAVRISFLFILLFAIFYFFFPSEWDKESKRELIFHYRRFVQKNDHGYFKPFMHVLSGFLLSLINAIMLSMNAFITLGFGRIPTTGLARYVCIIEGTIGWFLLSIFTVSLINQLLI